jgi:asparagine synthase (glutamine-hydrolysing)
MLSDVPVGVFLSGGTDSSAIIATLNRLGHVPKTFSIIFSERGFDESRHSGCIAGRYGTEHQAITVAPGQVLGQFDAMLAAYDQPSIDGINTYVISQAVRQAGIKVAISGLGGDEVFAGYPTFRRLPLLAKWLKIIPPGLARFAAQALCCRNSRGRAARLGGLMRSAKSRLDVYVALRGLFTSPARGDLLAAGALDGPGMEAELMAELSEKSAATDAINAVSLLELCLYMHNMLLRDTDQMSMAHGLEVRVPLLDHLLVEALAGIPGAAKLPSAGQPNKWLLVELAANSLPQQVVKRRKMGFVFPWDAWLRRELRGRVEQILTDRASVEQTGMRAPAVAALWQGYLRGDRAVRPSEILALVHLVSWADRNQMGPPVLHGQGL